MLSLIQNHISSAAQFSLSGFCSMRSRADQMGLLQPLPPCAVIPAGAAAESLWHCFLQTPITGSHIGTLLSAAYRNGSADATRSHMGSVTSCQEAWQR